MIPRLVQKSILDALETRKILLLFGPRQAGKTTLLAAIQTKLETDHKRVLYLNCDTEEDRSSLNTTAKTLLLQLTEQADVLLIDEAQRLDNPGLTLKILYDHVPRIHIIATGSSSFQLKNTVSDALTGRYLDFTLYPLSLTEIASYAGFSLNPVRLKQQTDTLLDHLLLYGTYPDVYLQPSTRVKQQLLTTITQSYLFKDVLSFGRIRHSQALVDLARALAYQIGSEVNEHELSNRLKIDRKTVVSYLDVLEQSYVIFRVHPYSRNPRREIGHKFKVYFLDIGIRNALLGDFNTIALRADLGFLWENFVLMERVKMSAHLGNALLFNFWRTYGGAEVDWIERKDAKRVEAFECKYQGKTLSRGAHAFTKEYKIPVTLINRETYPTYLLSS